MSDQGSVPIDLGQFREVFFEEAAEHLDAMESLLVRLDGGQADDEDLNAIFRAAHSIKGGAATFGLAEVIDVTHVVESLLDRARKHELTLDAAMIDTLLAARDLVAQQIDGARGGESPSEASRLAICARVRAHLDDAPAPVIAVARSPRITRHLVEVRVFGGDGASIDDAAVERALATFGSVERLGAEPVEVQPGSEADRRASARGETVRFHVAIDGDADVDLVQELAFVVAPENVRVVEKVRLGEADDGAVVVASLAPAAAGGTTKPADDPGYGFFDDAPGLDPGYGFFDDGPGAPAVAPTPVAVPSPSAPTAPTPARDADRGPAAETSIRVAVEKVDSLINLVGELVITQAMLTQTSAAVDPVAHERLLAGIAQLERNTRDLQEAVMSVRMMPMAVVFSRFPRVVRDLAAKLGKQVELTTEGEATELDKGLVEKIIDPMTHLVRNAIDHGIESPAAREAAGKPARGTILLRAFHRGGNVVIEVADDGAGLDRERILAKARERGMDVDDAMSDAEVFALIFEAGFSTAAVVTDVSGRGVGMDVVRRNIRELGGRVEIESAKGAGTRIVIRLPLTLAILDGMSIGAGGETYIVPLTNVVESLQVSASDLRSVQGRGRVIEVRGQYLPVVALAEALGAPDAEIGRSGVFLILESDGEQVALWVDELLGQHQVVIKSLETNFRRVPGLSGATIMGDGRVALILDVAAIVRRSRH